MPEDKEQEEPIEAVEPIDPEDPEKPTPNTMFDDIKVMCGIARENKDFDAQIRIYANGALSTLWQLGTFSGKLYSIADNSEWDDLETDPELQAAVKEYICLRTKLTFDPPQSSSLETAMTSRMDELEFRINVLADTRDKEGIDG